MQDGVLLLIGEVCIDFTMRTDSTPTKMRLGGVVHAARGLWACGARYAVAAVCPEYLAEEAEAYLRNHGCCDFIRLADVVGAPNVFVIGDVREVGDQGYENLLRDMKKVRLLDVKDQIRQYANVVVFPGAFDLAEVIRDIREGAVVTVDIAYDVNSIDSLRALSGRVSALAISTSSELFTSVAADEVSSLVSICRDIGATRLLLKENRGGSRVFNLSSGQVVEIPAVLGETVNSVGVGDAYTAVFAAIFNAEPEAAAWRGMQVATNYAQTTFPDDLRTNVLRQFDLTIEEVRELGGVILPWHDRKKFQIYLAAPDFSYIDKPEIDAAVCALEYHNFVVRRPILENGEASKESARQSLQNFYRKDVELLEACSLVLAIPLLRDPGTLVEVGMAIAMGKPVVTFDPRRENNNTMVICGSDYYSDDFDQCLTGIFECLSALRKNKP